MKKIKKSLKSVLKNNLTKREENKKISKTQYKIFSEDEKERRRERKKSCNKNVSIDEKIIKLKEYIRNCYKIKLR